MNTSQWIQAYRIEYPETEILAPSVTLSGNWEVSVGGADLTVYDAGERMRSDLVARFPEGKADDPCAAFENVDDPNGQCKACDWNRSAHYFS